MISLPRVRAGCAAAICALVLAAAARGDSTWVDAYRAARAAHAAGDYAGFRARMRDVAAVLGEQPGVNYNLACAAARLGERDEALRRLSLYAASGLMRDAGVDSDFVALWGDSSFRRIAARILANGDSIGTARVRHRFRDRDLLAEDVAYDPVAGRFYVTSVHRGTVTEVVPGASERVLEGFETLPGWSAFAAGVDARRRLLWISVAATPTADGYRSADSGRTALIAYDLRARRIVRRIEWPPDGKPHLIGDLTVGADGAVYATDSRSGAVRIVPAGGRTMRTLVPDGTFGSPQTPALAAGGRRLYVPDYSRGIAAIDLGDRSIVWLGFEPGVGLQGTDGLYVLGKDLIAVQNGTRPARVMRFRLDPSGTRVLGGSPLESGTLRLGEPTHGVIAGSSFWFLANTGWDRVGGDERMVEGPADPPALLEVALKRGIPETSHRR